MNTKKSFRKVDYQTYQNKYDEVICAHLMAHIDEANVEDLRTQMYGYTYTKDYAQRKIPDVLYMDYWRDSYLESIDLYEEDCTNNELNSEIYDDYIVDTPQERLLLQTIESTGDGMTPETAFCVIDVFQEYEFLDRVFPYNLLTVSRQRLLSKGIDCLEFNPNIFNVERIFFDVSRRFDVGYSNS